jgi:hypothetical protein
LDDIIEQVDEDDIPAYRTAWADMRGRIEGLMSSDSYDDFLGYIDETEIHNSHDMRMLASLGSVAATHGQDAVPLVLRTLEEVWQQGPVALRRLGQRTDEESQKALLIVSNMLRGTKNPLTTPDLPARMDDAIDVMLGNTTRRTTGRTDQTMPIIADDAAYEGAGYLTPATLSDLGGAPTRTVETQPDIGLGVATRERDLGGSTGAELVVDEAGRRYVQKRGASEGHIREESIADDVYEAMGVPVPKQRLIGDTKRANFIEGTTLDEFIERADDAEGQRIYDQLSEDFALDALLANWDAIGLVGDNVLVRDGVAYRVDNGGSLRYRAMGAPKGGAWGTSVGELTTLRDPDMNRWGARVYGALTDADIRRQVLDLDARRETILAALPEELRDTVSARLDDMLARTAGVEPSAGRMTADAITDETHAALVSHYNEVARLMNEQGVGGYQQWTAADAARMAGAARENMGRKPTSLRTDALDRQTRVIPSEVYFPPGAPNEKLNPLLDLLNQPENRGARDQFMSGLTAQFVGELRDDLGLIVDSTEVRGIGIWDGNAAQPLVPLHVLSTPQRGDELADVLSYAMQQAEVWHYTVRNAAEVTGNWSAYDPRVTIAFYGMHAKADAIEVAEKLGQQLPFARGATAIELPGGGWQISVVDRDMALPRKATGEVDDDAVAQMIEETEQGLGETNLGTEFHIEYGTTYVAGPSRRADGTLDWEGHHAATTAKLSARGAATDADALQRLRTTYDTQLNEGLRNAAPTNHERIARGEPISDVLEDRRGGQVFGTTTPVAANRAIIRGFGAADPLTGLHELVHVFSIAGMDESLRKAVVREWDEYTVAIEQKAVWHDAKAAAAKTKTTREKHLNAANALRSNMQNPNAGSLTKAQEEFFVGLVMDYINRGVPPNPDMANAFEHFRNWLKVTQKSREANGMPPIVVSPQMQAKLERLFSRPGVETVPYSPGDEVMRQAARQVVRSSWDEAHATQFYKRDRSMVERSINHPYIGLYPASYMWGKVLPEMVRFLAMRPFGMTTPFLAWNVVREVGDTIRTQSEADPAFKKFLEDNEDMFMFLSMFFPALPQDIPANVSLPIRRVAEQALENQQAYAEGREGKDIEYLRGAQDAIQYAVGPLGTIRTIGDVAGMTGELIGSVTGGEGGEETRPLIPLR